MARSNSGFFTRLNIEGASTEFHTDTLILSAELDQTVEQVSELAFVMNDPNWEFIKSFGEDGPLEKKAVYEDMNLVVSGFSVEGGPTGLGGTTIRLGPEGIVNLKKITDPLTRENISPSQYVSDAAQQVGMTANVEESPARPSIARDVAQEDSDTEANEWTTIKRLAGEEGFLVFELKGTLYFGSPQWLFDQSVEHLVGWGEDVPNEAFRLTEFPTVSVTSGSKTPDEISFSLYLEAAGEIQPGDSVKVLGIPKPMAEEKLLVVSVKFPLAGIGKVEVTAKKPWIIEKQSQPGSGDGSSTGPGTGATGPGPDLRNVTTPGENGLTPAATVLRNDIASRFGVTDIGGYRPEDGYGEHSTGRALDVMVYNDTANGTAIKDYCVANAENFGLNWCIWLQRLWYPGGTSDQMEDRGSPTQNHMDHVHVFIKY